MIVKQKHTLKSIIDYNGPFDLGFSETNKALHG